MPVNPKKYIDKLMKALEIQGRYYNYSQKRFYSKNTDRYCMKYILEDCQTKTKFEVYNKLEILKYLVREFSEATGRGVPEEVASMLDENNITAIDGGAKQNGLGVPYLNNFKHKYKEGRARGSRASTYNKKVKTDI